LGVRSHRASDVKARSAGRAPQATPRNLAKSVTVE
jgi:hypothetical protein